MVPFLFTLGLTAVLAVGGSIVSVYLQTQGLSRAKRFKGSRHLHPATADHSDVNPFYVGIPIADDEMSCYTRNALVVLILVFVIVGVIVTSVVNTLMH